MSMENRTGGLGKVRTNGGKNIFLRRRWYFAANFRTNIFADAWMNFRTNYFRMPNFRFANFWTDGSGNAGERIAPENI